jgi:flagellar basal body-associated protein FliL
MTGVELKGNSKTEKEKEAPVMKKSKLNLVILVVLILALSLSLVACTKTGTTPNSPNSTDGTPDVQQPSDQPAQTPADDGQTYTMRIGTPTSNDMRTP